MYGATSRRRNSAPPLEGDVGESGGDGDLVGTGQADPEAFHPPGTRIDRDKLAAGCGHGQPAPVGRPGHRVLAGAAERGTSLPG